MMLASAFEIWDVEGFVTFSCVGVCTLDTGAETAVNPTCTLVPSEKTTLGIAPSGREGGA